MERYTEPPVLVVRLSHIDNQAIAEVWDSLWLTRVEYLPMESDEQARQWAKQAFNDRRIALVWDVLDPMEQASTENTWQRWLHKAESEEDKPVTRRSSRRKEK